MDEGSKVRNRNISRVVVTDGLMFAHAVALAKESEQKPEKWKRMHGPSSTGHAGATVMYSKPSRGTCIPVTKN